MAYVNHRSMGVRITLLAAWLAMVTALFMASPAEAALKISGKATTQSDSAAPPPTPAPAAAAPKEETKPVAPAPEPAKAAAPKEEAKPAAPVEAAKPAAPAPEPAKAAAPKEEAKPAAPVEAAKPAAPAPEPAKAAAPKEEAPEAASVTEENVKEPQSAGPLMVDSEPHGAKVFVDGQEFGVTPVTIDGLSSMPHELVLYHPTLGAFSKKLDTGSGGVFIKLTADASKSGGAGFINLESNPTNARVDIDGKNMGLTPIKLPITSGKHTVLLSRAGFVDKELSVNVAEKQTVEVKETLKEKAGALLVIASPAEAEIFLDGQSVGKAAGPIRIAEVAPGLHEVRIEKKGYVGWKRDNVAVTREKTETVLVSLYPVHNETSVRLYAEPEGARVWLDGKEVGVAGPEGVGFVTTKGAHILKLELNPALKPGYRPLQVSVSFDEDTVDFKGLPFKLPVIDEAFIFAQRLYERGEGQEAMSYLDRVGKDAPSYPESRVMMIEILKDLGRVSEIPAEFDKLFDRQIYRKNPILNFTMGYWSIKAASGAQKTEAVKFLEKGVEALDRATESVDYFPAAERQVMALKSYYYTGMAAEMLFDITGDKKYVKKGAQAWELFFGRLKAGEETLGDEWIAKAKRHQTNLQYLEKKLGG